MSRLATCRKDKTCAWCKQVISAGDPMKWRMRLDGLSPVHPDCEDLAFTHDREMSMKRHPAAKEQTP